jgi:hypothetical protein
MLADFQQALVDVTAEPELCLAIRADVGVLASRYTLTDRETQRLLTIVRHAGMSYACTVYRMNRVAPLALNLRSTLRALGPALRPLLSAYWGDHPRGHAHFFLECHRFCRWLGERIEAGGPVPSAVSPILQRESAAVSQAIAASCTQAAGPQTPRERSVRATTARVK